MKQFPPPWTPRPKHEGYKLWSIYACILGALATLSASLEDGCSMSPSPRFVSCATRIACAPPGLMYCTVGHVEPACSSSSFLIVGRSLISPRQLPILPMTTCKLSKSTWKFHDLLALLSCCSFWLSSRLLVQYNKHGIFTCIVPNS